MVYVVLCAVAVLMVIAFAASIAGICSYSDRYAAPSFLNLMAGLSTTSFGAAIILCAAYSGLSVEAYYIPIGFCTIGVPFLISGSLQYRAENLQQAA